MKRERQWRVLGASVPGTSHQQSGLPCQDSHKWNLSPGGILVAAVADGAGSAPLSQTGSQVAADEAVATASQGRVAPTQFDEQQGKKLLASALEAARTAVEAAATKENHPAGDLASTLILVVAGADFAAAAQVGDGAVVIEDDQGRISALTRPQSGEFINETNFLTSVDYLASAQLVVWRGALRSLAVFSDGLEMLALEMPSCQPHVPFFATLFGFVRSTAGEVDAQEQLLSFLRSSRVTERTDDDLTLLLATCG